MVSPQRKPQCLVSGDVLSNLAVFETGRSVNFAAKCGEAFQSFLIKKVGPLLFGSLFFCPDWCKSSQLESVADSHRRPVLIGQQ